LFKHQKLYKIIDIYSILKGLLRIISKFIKKEIVKIKSYILLYI